MDIGMIVPPLASGFALSATGIFSIGPQNLQLVERGAMRDFPLTSASVGYGCEIRLVAASFIGLAGPLGRLEALNLVQLAAAAFLAGCGIMTLLRAAGPGRCFTAMPSRRAAMAAMLAVTLLNPLVYLEVVMVGGICSASYGPSAAWFGVGFLAASAVRFYGLSAFGWALSPWLRLEQARRALSAAAGSLLLLVAAAQAMAAAWQP